MNFLKRISIQHRLIFLAGFVALGMSGPAAILFSIVALMVTSFMIENLALGQSRDALEQVSRQCLISLRDLRKVQLERYLDTIRNPVQNLSPTNRIAEAMAAFKRTAANYDIEVADTQLDQWRTNLAAYYRDGLAPVKAASPAVNPWCT